VKIIIKLDVLLDKRDMSQNELSRLTGIRQPSIFEMCANKTKHLPLKNLAKICEVLNCQLTDILELVPE
jgi:Predicted transcriptional regulator